MSDDIDDTDSTRCDYCGRRFDRPSFADDCAGRHPAPGLAEKIVEAVEDEIHGRKGIGWRCLSDELVDEIRDELVEAVRREVEAWHD